jgi:hypothetical protein
MSPGCVLRRRPQSLAKDASLGSAVWWATGVLPRIVTRAVAPAPPNGLEQAYRRALLHHRFDGLMHALELWTGS